LAHGQNCLYGLSHTSLARARMFYSVVEFRVCFPQYSYPQTFSLLARTQLNIFLVNWNSQLSPWAPQFGGVLKFFSRFYASFPFWRFFFPGVLVSPPILGVLGAFRFHLERAMRIMRFFLAESLLERVVAFLQYAPVSVGSLR